MVMFHRYVSLPEGNGKYHGSLSTFLQINPLIDTWDMSTVCFFDKLPNIIVCHMLTTLFMGVQTYIWVRLKTWFSKIVSVHHHFLIEIYWNIIELRCCMLSTLFRQANMGVSLNVGPQNEFIFHENDEELGWQPGVPC